MPQFAEGFTNLSEGGSVFEGSGGSLTSESGNSVPFPGGTISRNSIGLAQANGGFGTGHVDIGFGGGGFFDVPGRDPRPDFSGMGSVMGPIGSVGPDAGIMDKIFDAIQKAIQLGDIGSLLRDQISKGPRDSNGVPVVNPVGPGDVTDVIDNDDGVDIGTGGGGDITTPPVVTPPVVTPPVVTPPLDLQPGGGDDGDSDGNNSGDIKIVTATGVTTVAATDNQIINIGGAVGESQSGGSSFTRDISETVSESEGLAGARSADTIAFEDVFARLFGGAEGAAAGLDPSMLTDTANQLFSGGLGFLDQLSGGADTDFLEGTISGSDDLLNEQIGGLGDDIGRFFREQVLPGIESEAIAGGSLGGSRQGLAEGEAGDAAIREFQRGSTALRTADRQQRIDASGVLGQSRVAGGAAGLEGLEPLAGVSDVAFGADLQPFERLAALLGNQVSLTSSSSESEDFASSLSKSFGEGSASQFSEGSNKAFRLGFGD